MPLSAEEISKRYETRCKRIQDSILVMESCLARNSKYDFDFNKVIGNLQQTNMQEEKRAVPTMIHALEEYNKLLNLDDQRRKYFALFENKEKIGNIRLSIREKRQKEQINYSPYKIMAVEDNREKGKEQMCEDGNEETLA